jgi:transposase
MPAIPLRGDWDAVRVREAARLADDAGQARRLLAIAAVYDGMSRASAATLGGMDRQTLRDWVHRFNADGPAGLVDRKAPGAAPRLSAAQKAELAALVEAGPQPEADGVVRWRCIDLKALIRRRFGVDYHERTIGKLRADTEAMQVHLDEIAGAVAPGAHAVVLLDQAGWHTHAQPAHAGKHP